MRPTVDSIKSAIHGASFLEDESRVAVLSLEKAKVLFQSGCPMAAKNELELAREALSRLRRTQTAALAHIDAALDSCAEATGLKITGGSK